MPTDEQTKTIHALIHAMQSGVAYDPDKTSEEGKHLRVGVNNALVESGVIAKLLIDKGIVTDEEYGDALIEGLVAEVNRYEKYLEKKFGTPVKLL